MQQIYPVTKTTSYPKENHDDEKRRFFGTIKSLYQEAMFNDITTVDDCFYYDNSNNLTISYNVKSPYLIIQAIVKPEGLFSQEDFKERILSNYKEPKGIFINIEEEENRKIQIAIPVSIANHTDSLKNALIVVEDMIRQENNPYKNANNQNFRFYIKTQSSEEGPYSAQEMAKMNLADWIQVREVSMCSTWFSANNFDFYELAQEEKKRI